MGNFGIYHWVLAMLHVPIIFWLAGYCITKGKVLAMRQQYRSLINEAKNREG